VLEAYPHNINQGDVPNFLLRNSEKHKMFEMYPSIHEDIEYEFEHKQLFSTDDHFQLVYE
jgi:hypothetical protein